MKYLFSVISFLSFFFCSASYANLRQINSGYNLQGVIVGTDMLSLTGASIKLTSVKTGQVNSAISGIKGEFTFANLKAGQYALEISYVSLEAHKVVIELNGDTILKSIALSVANLQEVAITATTKLVEQKGDRVVVNVEANPIMTGNSVLEILGKSPGISVGSEGAISMKGKQGVMVMISDKPVRLSGNELAEFLRGISGTNVSKLELITNPPAKYEAAGTSGIINIKLKKDARSGLNGNISLNNGSGKYIKTNNGGMINFNAQELSLSANYNYSHRNEFQDMDISRQFLNLSDATTVFNQDYYQRNAYATHSPRLRGDYKLNKKLNIGAELFGNFTKIKRKADSKSFNDGLIEEAFNTTLNGRKSYGANFNSSFKLDSLGSSISADVDYSRFNLYDIQNYNISSANTNSGNPLLLFNKGRGRLGIKSAALNYQGILQDGFKLEAGLKAASVTSATEFDFFNQSNGANIYDSDLSSKFTYKEKIRAGFISLNGKIESVELQAGLRYENTSTSGSKFDSTAFARSYHQLFPSASVVYHLKPEHSLMGAFSRRIQRPSYSQINPFFYFLDLSTRFTGNPDLKPATSYSSELSYTFKEKYTFSAGYFITKDAITDIQFRDENEHQVLIQQPVNIEKYKVYSLNAYLPVKVSKSLNSVNTIGVYKSFYSGRIGNDLINNAKPYLFVNSANTLVIKNWTIQLNVSYEGRQFYGNTEISPITIFSMAFQKKILSKQGMISLNFNDLFKGNQFRSMVNTSQYTSSLSSKRDTQSAIIGFLWRFGIKQKSTEGKKGSADDEKKRAN